MDKDKLREIIILDLKKSWTDSAEKIAERIISKIPDDIVIAEGMVKDGVLEGEFTGSFEFNNKDENEKLSKIAKELNGKKCLLKLEVLE